MSKDVADTMHMNRVGVAGTRLAPERHFEQTRGVAEYDSLHAVMEMDNLLAMKLLYAVFVVWKIP